MEIAEAKPMCFKIHVDTVGDNVSSQLQSHEKSWQVQLWRLVKEAPQPIPVHCTEPRRFPHRGNNNRISESSWTSLTTCSTDVTLSCSSSLTALENKGEGKDGAHTSESEILEKSTPSRIPRELVSIAGGNISGRNGASPNWTEDKHEMESYTSSENKFATEDCSETVKRKVLPLPLKGRVEPKPPQEDSSTTTKHPSHNHTQFSFPEFQEQTGDKSRHLSIQGDSDYWEKFRYSKDYQSSLMIETICNEVFNLKPSTRFKNLMKLSQKSRRERESGKSKQRRQKESSSLTGGVAMAGKSNEERESGNDIVKVGNEKTDDRDELCEKENSISATLQTDSNKREREQDLKEVEPTETGRVSSLQKRPSMEEKKCLRRQRPSTISRKKSCLSTDTASSVFTTITTEEADDNHQVFDKFRRERMLMTKGFGQIFHGYLTKWETETILSEEGQYLIRQVWNEDAFILSFLFDGEIRNYRIICDVTVTTSTPGTRRASTTSTASSNDSSESMGNVYTYYLENRSKCYYTLNELVREGLITLHLDENAGSYIDLLVELAQFQQTDNLLQIPPAATLGSRKNSRSASLRTMRLTSASSAFMESSNRGETDEEDSSSFPVDISKKSVDIALLIHYFEEETFEGLAKCHICSRGLRGDSKNGLRCRDCGLTVHESCTEEERSECKPDLLTIPPFSTDLTTLVKGSSSAERGAFGLPYILEKCINELTARGLDAEGIYRVSGSVEDIENLKSLFEKERVNADLTKCMDIHSITGLIKFFFRQLPDSLITQEAFDEFISGEDTCEMTKERVQVLISCLPPAHRLTLRHFLDHLNHVAKEKALNKMNAFNLSSVLMPSVMGPANMSFDVLESSTKLLHFLITHVNNLQF